MIKIGMGSEVLGNERTIETFPIFYVDTQILFTYNLMMIFVDVITFTVQNLLPNNFFYTQIE